MANLPEELITEILLKLPIKSLLKFRSVCKSWLELISSPEFVKNHLLLSTTNKDYNHHGILLKFASKNEHGVKDCSLRVVLYHPETGALVDLDYPEIEKPCNFKEYHHLVLGVLGSDLSVLCNNTWRHTDVWVMKEYGVKESWTKMLAIKKSPVGFRSHVRGPPILMSNEGEYLIGQGFYQLCYLVPVLVEITSTKWNSRGAKLIRALQLSPKMGQ
ncbi:putative F-box/kelch-repeat protein-like isoform X3 [Capsicum annuum]|nr:putative F-box/kelch-repeat protein-like isoform X3 [Capsicum annuum]